MKVRYKSLPTFAIVVLSAAVGNTTTIFSNNSFETDAWTGEHSDVTPSGWSATTDSDWPKGFDSAFGTATTYEASDGDQFVVLGIINQGTDAWIEQTVSGFVVGRSYVLSFDLSPQGAAAVDNHPLDVTIDGGAATQFNVMGVPGASPYASWTTQNLPFTATDTDHTFRFQGAGVNGLSGHAGLDNIQLTVVPEPSYVISLTVFVLCFGLVGWCRRSRARAP